MTTNEDKKETKAKKQKTVIPAEAEELKIGEVPSKLKKQEEQSTKEKKEAKPFGENNKQTTTKYSERERKLWKSIVENASIYTIVKLLRDAPEYEELVTHFIANKYGEEEVKRLEDLKATLW